MSRRLRSHSYNLHECLSHTRPETLELNECVICFEPSETAIARCACRSQFVCDICLPNMKTTFNPCLTCELPLRPFYKNEELDMTQSIREVRTLARCCVHLCVRHYNEGGNILRLLFAECDMLLEMLMYEFQDHPDDMFYYIAQSVQDDLGGVIAIRLFNRFGSSFCLSRSLKSVFMREYTRKITKVFPAVKL